LKNVVEAELVDREGAFDDERPKVRLQHVRVLGVVGTLLALLTMAAAFSLGMMMLFGTTLLCATTATLLWPAIFSPEFTQWVFGAPQVSFWKLFVLFLAAGAILKAFRKVNR
jgi:hypothetical protein